MNNNNNGSNSHAGVRRSRDTNDVTTSSTSKRQKLDHEVETPKIQSPKDLHVNSSPELSTSAVNDDLCIDPKVEDETSISSSNGFSRETSASSEICLDSDEMESSSTLRNKKKKIVASRSPTCKVTGTNNPTAAEIDDFFAAAEKKEQKRFAEKYNYDFVNDVPMEGRYQWVRLKP
ncbi:cyclin-dependent kinase inhibitor 7-like protein isoform X1 [Tanacetum coccineum]|uniref:Cyclin-dependent kinase inhibitor 7-like protein isoform X1 n=1 Tax=Tanacetum coccineum TaxID=301880 RepID=A0ABQ5FBG1_9ASTR